MRNIDSHNCIVLHIRVSIYLYKKLQEKRILYLGRKVQETVKEIFFINQTQRGILCALLY
jgi:hypothetical protein